MTCNIDHIVPQYTWVRRHGNFKGWNSGDNLRVLCRRCHVLRDCHSHQGMIAKALADGVIDENWREQVWG